MWTYIFMLCFTECKQNILYISIYFLWSSLLQCLSEKCTNLYQQTKKQQILAMLVWSPNCIKAPGLRPIKTWRMHAHILQMPSFKSKCLHFHLNFPISFLKDGVDKNKDWIWEKSGEQTRPLRLMFCRRHFQKYLYFNSKFPILFQLTKNRMSSGKVFKF